MTILPPSSIGILGGGQLGRMTALAARQMGYGVQVLDPLADCAARPVVDRVVTARFDDPDGAAALARECAVVTLEIEQIAPAALDAVLAHALLRPGAEALCIIRDRQLQKEWLAAQGFPIGRYVLVSSVDDLAAAQRDLGPLLFVKACEGGYDGRSQVRLGTTESPADAFALLGNRRSVAEQGLDLALELSVLVARRPSGDTRTYPAALNQHERQILAWSVLPAELPPNVAAHAERMAEEIARAVRLEGILAVEMFVLRTGELLVNELAPRPHNSYHASELACPTSQFEQLVRAVCDLPLGDVTPARPSAIVNLFGDLWLEGRTPAFARALEVEGTRLFLYGKHAPREGRKMGHLAAIGDTPRQALERVQRAAARL